MQPLSYDTFPRAFLENLVLSQDMIASIRIGRLEHDIDDDLLYQLRNPSRDIPELDEQTQISLELFSALAAHPKSAYDEARRVFNKTRPDSPLHSYWVVKSRLEKLSGITQIKRTCVQILVSLSLVLSPTCNSVLNVLSADMTPRSRVRSHSSGFT